MLERVHDVFEGPNWWYPVNVEKEKDLALFPLSNDESHALWNQIYRAVCSEYKPVTNYQLILCHQLAVCEWRKLRMLRHETSRIRRDQTLAKSTSVPKGGSPHMPSVKLSMDIADYELIMSRVASGLRREITALTKQHWDQRGANWVSPVKAWQDKWQYLTQNIDTFDLEEGMPQPLTEASITHNIAH